MKLEKDFYVKVGFNSHMLTDRIINQNMNIIIATLILALSSFCGELHRKYSTFEAVPLLQYIVNQLKDDNSHDLIILEQLITKMTGIEVISNMSDNQIACFGGSETLRIESINTSIAEVRRTSRKSSTRLKDSLIESGLAIPLMILLSQQRQTCIFHKGIKSSRYLKLIGNAFDAVRIFIFINLNSFLSFILNT